MIGSCVILLSDIAFSINLGNTQAISIILDMCVIDALERLYYLIVKESFSMKSWLLETKFTITLLSHSKHSTTSLSLTISSFVSISFLYMHNK